MSGLYPTRAETPAHIVRPDSDLYRFGGDARIFGVIGATLLLQVAHRTVGLAVGDHSRFQTDPYGRLLGSLDLFNLTVYGGPQLPQIGRNLRRMHSHIQGTAPDGTHYYALEPGAWAWVAATTINAIPQAMSAFGTPLSRVQVETVYRAHRKAFRFLGVHEEDLPPTWDGFCNYFDHMLDDVLERTPVFDLVLRSLWRIPSPPLPVPLVSLAWPLARVLPAHILHTTSVGMLPPRFRDRIGLSWNPVQAAELKALQLAVSHSLPDLSEFGRTYLDRRRKAILAGPLGRGLRDLPRLATPA